MTPNAESDRITFAIPFYSDVPYLVRTLRSILAQRDDAWDAIVVDDGNAPGVADTVAAIGGGRIRYQKNPKNLGLGGNFNRCFDVAETAFVTVLHADDELLPGYTGAMRAAAAQHPEAAAFYCGATIIGPDSRPRFSLADIVKDRCNPARRSNRVLAGEEGVRALLVANFIVAPTLCFRRSHLGGRRFPEEYRFVLDWALTMQLLLDGESIVGLAERLYLYRRHANNMTEQLTKTHQRFREESAFYDHIRDAARVRRWDACVALAEKKRMVKLHVTYRALKSLALGELSDARRGMALLRDL